MSAYALPIALFLALGIASWFLTPRLWADALISLGRRQSGLASHAIEVDGVKWHYLRGGHGPTLLLLHGFGADSTSWIRLAPILRHRFELLIPDLPGFGESEPPQRLDFTIESQAKRLAEFLGALDIGPCLVAGNSMGGYLATTLAAHHPDRIRALWLLAPLGLRSVEPGAVLRAIDEGDFRYLQISSVRQFRELLLPALFSSRRWLPGPLIKSLARKAISIRNEVPRMLREARFESEPLESIAARVSQPVLVQWGDGDQLVNPAGLAVLGNAFRDADCELTEHCGHLPMLERPGESARLFCHFLATRNLA